MSAENALNFERDAIRAFRFVRCEFDPQTGVARLVYAFDDGPELVETVTVPGAPFVLEPARAAAAPESPAAPRAAAMDAPAPQGDAPPAAPPTSARSHHVGPGAPGTAGSPRTERRASRTPSW